MHTNKSKTSTSSTDEKEEQCCLPYLWISSKNQKSMYELTERFEREFALLSDKVFSTVVEKTNYIKQNTTIFKSSDGQERVTVIWLDKGALLTHFFQGSDNSYITGSNVLDVWSRMIESSTKYQVVSSEVDKMLALRQFMRTGKII